MSSINRQVVQGVVLAILLLLSGAVVAEQIIRIVAPESANDHRQDYYRALLKLALDKTAATYGPYRFEAVSGSIQGRRVLLMSQGNQILDVIWTMTSQEREAALRPIRIPLLKGLMGARLLIINKRDKALFAQINTLPQLQQLRAIQGHDWPDTQILQANHFSVLPATIYESMFKMIALGRGDYFPRGLNEPFVEVAERPELDLMVEPHLMIYYFSPFFFFVNASKPELRERIETGLRLAINDGSFDKLFYSDPDNQKMLNAVDFAKMTIFRIPNPLLTKETAQLQGDPRLVYPLPVAAD
jgi:hypothetical protein